jgi:hypothetical protein
MPQNKLKRGRRRLSRAGATSGPGTPSGAGAIGRLTGKRILNSTNRLPPNAAEDPDSLDNDPWTGRHTCTMVRRLSAPYGLQECMDLVRDVLMGGHYQPKNRFPVSTASLTFTSVGERSDLRSNSESAIDFFASG